MSGIAGIWHLDGRPIELTDLHAMVESLAHRGPHGTGIWSQGSIGFGHAMLHSTPESQFESLPMKNRSGDLVITADARIDNRAELFEALAIDRRPKNEIGDTELILSAYEKWGEDCPAKLIGDFAFAIWDERSHELFYARDHFGVKPFYFYRNDRLLVFASEIKALFRLPQVPRRIHQPRIADFLIETTESIDNTCTFFEEVFRFPPAHSSVVTGCQQRTRSYWSPDLSQQIDCRSDEEYAEAFLEVFAEAVKCRLRGAAGSMLSGGLDSSAIVGVGHKLRVEQGSRLPTFSAASNDETDCPETRSINATIRNLPELDPRLVTPDQFAAFLPDVDRVMELMDDLFDTILMDGRLMMYSAAHQQGLTSLLDGVDGDVVVSHGTTCIRYLLRAGNWRDAVAEAFGYSRLHRRYGVESAWKLLYQYGRKAFIPCFVRNIALGLIDRRRGLPHLTKDSVVSLDFARRIGLSERYRIYTKNRMPKHPRTLREYHKYKIVAPFVTVALERYDRVASAFSIEPRHPFFDKRLAEFCLALPWKQLVYRGWQKVILRRSVKQVLPSEVSDCGQIFAGPRIGLQELWLERQRKLLKESLFDRSSELEPFVDLPNARKSYNEYLSGNQTLERTYHLWNAAVLALWLRRNECGVPIAVCGAN